MQWVIEEFLNRNDNGLRMERALNELNVDYMLVNLDNGLRVIDKETRSPLENSQSTLEKFMEKETIIYGSKRMENLVYEYNIYPGMYKNESFEYDEFVSELGNLMLNDDMEIGLMKDLKVTEVSFIRPVENSKLFTGQVVDRETFSELQSVHYKSTERIMISPIKEIDKEYRVFVVDGKCVTGSSYVINGIYNADEAINDDIVNFVEQVHSRFPISKAYVIDIAKVGNDYKVIEYNNINTSGLYGGDEFKLVKAIECL